MSSPVSRRTILRAAGAAALLGASAGVLPMFSTPSRKQTPQSCPSVDHSDTEHELTVSNWPAYMDPIDQPGSTVSTFEQATGITVRYTEDVSDNDSFFAKVVNQLGSCEPVNRDLFVLTDYMCTQMINLGWIQAAERRRQPAA